MKKKKELTLRVTVYFKNRTESLKGSAERHMVKKVQMKMICCGQNAKHVSKKSQTQTLSTLLET